jgi:hypothetical protein
MKIHHHVLSTYKTQQTILPGSVVEVEIAAEAEVGTPSAAPLKSTTVIELGNSAFFVQERPDVSRTKAKRYSKIQCLPLPSHA